MRCCVGVRIFFKILEMLLMLVMFILVYIVLTKRKIFESKDATIFVMGVVAGFSLITALSAFSYLIMSPVTRTVDITLCVVGFVTVLIAAILILIQDSDNDTNLWDPAGFDVGAEDTQEHADSSFVNLKQLGLRGGAGGFKGEARRPDSATADETGGLSVGDELADSRRSRGWNGRSQQDGDQVRYKPNIKDTEKDQYEYYYEDDEDNVKEHEDGENDGDYNNAKGENQNDNGNESGKRKSKENTEGMIEEEGSLLSVLRPGYRSGWPQRRRRPRPIAGAPGLSGFYFLGRTYGPQFRADSTTEEDDDDDEKKRSCPILLAAGIIGIITAAVFLADALKMCLYDLYY